MIELWKKCGSRIHKFIRFRKYVQKCGIVLLILNG